MLLIIHSDLKSHPPLFRSVDGSLCHTTVNGWARTIRQAEWVVAQLNMSEQGRAIVLMARADAFFSEQVVEKSFTIPKVIGPYRNPHMQYYGGNKRNYYIRLMEQYLNAPFSVPGSRVAHYAGPESTDVDAADTIRLYVYEDALEQEMMERDTG